MGLFDFRNDLEESNKKIKNLQLNNDVLQKYIDDIKNQKSSNDFNNEEILYGIVCKLDKISGYNGYSGYSIKTTELLELTIAIYQMMIHNSCDFYEESFYFKFLDQMFNDDYEPFVKILLKSSNFTKLKQFYNLFNKKVDDNSETEYTKTYDVDIWINLVGEMKDFLLEQKQMPYYQKEHCFELIINYILEIRRYYADQISFVADIESFFSKIKNYQLSPTDLEKIIITRIEEIQKMNGVYNYGVLDFLKLAQYSSETNELNDLVEKISKKIQQNLDSINKLDIYVDEFKKNTDEIKTKIVSSIQKDIFNYFRSQKKEQNKQVKEEWKILNMYSILVAQDFQSIREEMENTKTMIDDQVLSEYQKLVEMLTTSNIKINKSENIQPTLSKDQEINSSIPVRDTGSCIAYFNKKLPLKKRIDLVNKNKEKGKLYHERFDDIIKAILNNDLVYLVGPSGSGKTYLVNQIADMLKLPMYNLGFIVDEFSSIKGYLDAHGHFVATPFYYAYKYGGICFLDEIDNSESKALIELNKIVGTNGYQPYLFPNGELVETHPNFRIIAAGNTWGDGPSLSNNTREKLDEATMNRFTAYYIDYDEKLESTIMNKYPKYYEALKLIREFYRNKQYPYIITTRDMREIAQRLDTGCFTLEEILASKIVKNKRPDTLKTIIELLENKDTDDKFVKSLKLCQKKVKDYR